jgi:hypothetical protein
MYDLVSMEVGGKYPDWKRRYPARAYDAAGMEKRPTCNQNWIMLMERLVIETPF